MTFLSSAIATFRPCDRSPAGWLRSRATPRSPSRDEPRSTVRRLRSAFCCCTYRNTAPPLPAPAEARGRPRQSRRSGVPGTLGTASRDGGCSRAVSRQPSGVPAVTAVPGPAGTMWHRCGRDGPPASHAVTTAVAFSRQPWGRTRGSVWCFTETSNSCPKSPGKISRLHLATTVPVLAVLLSVACAGPVCRPVDNRGNVRITAAALWISCGREKT